MWEWEACVVRMVERVDRGVNDDDVSNDEADNESSPPPTDDDREDMTLLLLLYLFGVDGDCGLPFRRGVLDVECEFGRRSLLLSL